LKNISKVLIVITISILFSACRDEVITPPPIDTIISEGAYILSEGGFSAGSSKLSFYNLTNDNFTENIFNSGTLGLFPDGLILNSNRLYVTAQGNFGSAGTISTLDTVGTLLQSNGGGINPYSIAIANDKIYVTNGPSNSVTVVNKNNLNFVTTIPVGLYPQEILSVGSKIFVCNTSVFGGGTDSTVSVIDASTDQVVATLQVRKTPSSLAVTNDGKLLVGCPGGSAEGIIYKFDPDTYAKLDSFSIVIGSSTGFAKDIAVDKNSNDIYFITNTNDIAKLNLSSRVNSQFIANTNPGPVFFYGYNFDSKNKKHYVADVKDFLTSGSVYIYNENGTIIRTFSTGIGPRRIVVKN